MTANSCTQPGQGSIQQPRVSIALTVGDYFVGKGKGGLEEPNPFGAGVPSLGSIDFARGHVTDSGIVSSV